ncbi:MAG TPA: S8 family serine peptidase, partial [Jatrophihabitans sp.]|nr:S8 family serine peptidase [Jatrophihabitans sp.]
MTAVRDALLAGTLACAALAVPSPAAAGAAPSCVSPQGVYRAATPWPQQLFDPQRVWPLTDGSGQTVAVLGTGVDARNGQFGRSQVRRGVDLLGSGAADDDCDGRGTFAAGIVAARPASATTFAGLAPGARLLPIRYTQTSSNGVQGGEPNRLAAAIDTAQAAGADVILVVVPAAHDSADLRTAVAHATAHGALVIGPVVGSQAGTRSYPAADPGALGVAPVDEQGQAVQAEGGSQVALAAPGARLVSTAAGTASGRLGHAWGVDDAEFAAAYVAGAAALLRAYRPELAPQQVVVRLTVTADRAGDARNSRLGWGIVDP